MVLVLSRTYFPDGTNSRLKCEGKFICIPLNCLGKRMKRRLCIPEGNILSENVTVTNSSGIWR
jgi:hypothetical protein